MCLANQLRLPSFGELPPVNPGTGEKASHSQHLVSPPPSPPQTVHPQDSSSKGPRQGLVGGSYRRTVTSLGGTRLAGQS